MSSSIRHIIASESEYEIRGKEAEVRSSMIDVPSARHGHSLCFWNNKLYLFGGTADGDLGLNDLHEFDFDTFSWSNPRNIGVCVPVARSSHSAVALGSSIIIFGGSSHDPESGSNLYLNDIYVLDTATLVWYPISTTGHSPSPRWGHTATMTGRDMFVFGGAGKGERLDELPDVYVLHTSTWTWTCPKIDGLEPYSRKNHTASAIGDSIVFYGGHNKLHAINDLTMLNIRTLRWTHVNVDVLDARELHAGAVTSTGKIIFQGGFRSRTRFQDMIVFDPAEFVFSSLQDLCLRVITSNTCLINRAIRRASKFNENTFARFIQRLAQLGRLDHRRLATVLRQCLAKQPLRELSLRLCGERVRDAWMKTLGKNAYHLNSLDLTWCRVSCKCIKYLVRLANLKTLWLSANTNISYASLASLSLYLPDLTIYLVRTDLSTRECINWTAQHRMMVLMDG